MKKFPLKSLLFFIPIYFFAACNIDGPVTNDHDYSVFLDSTMSSPAKQVIETDLRFWTDRINKTPDDLVSQIKLGSLYSKHFAYSGNIGDIIISDSLYKKANELQHRFSSGLYRSLAANAVTQHQFREAQCYLDTSLKMGDDRNITWLQQFDVALELGNTLLAQQVLNDVDPNSFEYLIRSARFLDHCKGDLNSAIRNMELALVKARESGNKSLVEWTMTNLGDMYGHANRFKDSYQSYLTVLKQDAGSHHALKGIAWLAFSHDKNSIQAKKIIKYLQSRQPLPDYYLMMAEIEGFQKNIAGKSESLGEFIRQATRPCYGDMYNKYLFNVYTENLKDYNSAFAIALREVSNRPTPESYDMLAYALLNKGKLAESKMIAEKFVINKCFEPSAKYHLGMIAEANGEIKEARIHFEDALSSSFELGPSISERLKAKIIKSESISN
jgi:tetratricopeptide (TPR) repeat protein